MTKETRGRPKQHKDLVALTVRLERTMMDELDAFIDRLQQERGGFPVNRVDVVRVALREYLDAHKLEAYG